MQKERYEIADGKLYLLDPEVELEICEPFELPALPRVCEKGASSSEKAVEVIWNRDSQGRLAAAYMRKDGRFHGQYLQFHPCGKIKGDAFYQEGKLHVPSVFVSNAGTTLASTWFYRGVPVGKAKQFYPSGELYSIQRYKKGKLHGKQEYFYEDKSLKTFLSYQEGDLHGAVELFWPSGLLKRSAFFSKGRRQGEDIIWSEAGLMLDYGQYEQGDPCGSHKKYYRNGVLKEEQLYRSSQRFDHFRWDPQGVLVYERVYLDENTFEETDWSSLQGPLTKKGRWDGQQIHWL